MSVPNSEGEPITEAGLAALKAELGELETVGRREIAGRIRTARAHGDLSENGEYHAAKEDQAHLETRIQRLRQRLRDAVVVQAAEGPGLTLAFGRSAEVRDEGTGEVHTWTIVGATEADRARGRLSVQSPVGKALLDHPPGATVEVPVPGRYPPTHDRAHPLDDPVRDFTTAGQISGGNDGPSLRCPRLIDGIR